MRIRARARELAQQQKRQRRNMTDESNSTNTDSNINSSSGAPILVSSEPVEERPNGTSRQISTQVCHDLDGGEEERKEVGLIGRQRSSVSPDVPSSSVLQDKSFETSQNFLLSLPGEADRQIMSQSTDAESLSQYSRALAKMTLWGADLIARFGGADDKFPQIQGEWKRQIDDMKAMHVELKKSYADLQERYSNLQADHEKLDAQLLDVRACHSQKLEKVKEESLRNFPNSKEGKELLQWFVESKKEEFLCSEELQKKITDQSLVYYYFGYKYLKDELKLRGINAFVLKSIKRDGGLSMLPDDTSILDKADSDEESEEEGNEIPPV
ncbi:hypothetical protein CDL12_04072 [Handroanthus impetiginosus]|uniref:Uncharacterized protein n=1 Tax=Handroanthus impetiginosus TaxID=429701 RepID=A0A2G9I0T4_9LAMI|nr:hypothetical protein CDL12_04072 [Handroanthus impetiginosus]